MKLLAWNILHGGGSRRMPHITLALVEHDADVIVISEYRTTIGGQIRAVLADHGWRHQRCTDPGRGQNGVLLASRHPLRDPGDRTEFAHKICRRRWVDAEIPDLDLVVAGVHVPCEGRDSTRAAFLKGVIDTARRRLDDRFVLIGDFNLGRHHLDESGATFQNTAMLGKLATLGYVDAWRHLQPEGREYSWFSHEGAGFRIDHAFVAPNLAGSIVASWYSHEERDTGISDHSALLVTLDRAAPASPKA